MESEYLVYEYVFNFYYHTEKLLFHGTFVPLIQ